jgi:hypothetical protein
MGGAVDPLRVPAASLPRAPDSEGAFSRGTPRSMRSRWDLIHSVLASVNMHEGVSVMETTTFLGARV